LTTNYHFAAAGGFVTRNLFRSLPSQIAAHRQTLRQEIFMKRYSITILAGLFLYCAIALAGNAQFAEGKQMFTGIRDNLIQMAESMPETEYQFKPAAEIRSFGEMVAHVASAQAGICSMAAAGKKAVEVAGTASKAELISALKESSAFCAAAWDGLTETTAAETVMMGKTPRSKLGILIFNNLHDFEEYGYMAVYLRLKGIVPPTTQKSVAPPSQK
jgi:hypothetical protein